MKLFFPLIFLGSLGYGLWHLSESYPELKDRAMHHLPTQTFSALESRFTINQILENERPKLLKDSQNQVSNHSTIFHPFLLMEVKFTRSNQSTEEAVILWDLMDGEMILDTQSWEKSHGFADCIQMHADPYELKIISAIAQHGNQANRQLLFQMINIESDMLDVWIDRCLKKKLIISHQGTYRIHLESPKMAFPPATNITFPLITKNLKHSEKLKKNFSLSQITRFAEAIFGDNFAIRQMHEIFLPIYSLTIQNGDGSFQTTYWNGLNGQRID